VQQAFLAAIPPAVTTSIELGLILFAWVAGRDRQDRVAVIGFKACEYRGEGSPEKPAATFVGELSRDEVKEVCKKLVDVQERPDDAVDQVRKVGGYSNASDFGAKVHKIIADGINGLKERNYRAEVSVMKSKLEGGTLQQVGYGPCRRIRESAQIQDRVHLRSEDRIARLESSEDGRAR
jgi:hypothetical protein